MASKVRIAGLSSCALGLTWAMIASCSAHGHGNSGSAGPSGLIAGVLHYDPHPAEVGVVLTISGSASNVNPGSPTATYSAVRDGSVTVATGSLSWPIDGGTAPIVFTDLLTAPGQHSYVVSILSGNGGDSSMILDLPVVFNLSPDIAQESISSSEAILTITMTNNGSGPIAFVMPYSITSNSLASPVIEHFDFASLPLSPGASRSQPLNISLPLSSSITYTVTVDPLALHGTNLAGMPATAQIVMVSGGG